MFPGSSSETYVFFDTVHRLKKFEIIYCVQKKLYSLAFNFNYVELKYLQLQDTFVGQICNVFEMDQHLDANLIKAPKLTYSSLHPGDNKQSVELAIAVFHETTIVAAQNYFPERLDIHNCLKLVMCWWLIANSMKRYTPNVLSNAVTNENGEMSIYLKFADWIEDWSTRTTVHFCLTKQTPSALVLTLHSQAMLIQELFEEGYEFVLPRRLQSDVVERRFSQYRQVSGGTS